MSRKNKRLIQGGWGALFLVILAIVVGVATKSFQKEEQRENFLSIYFFDVGQADSILLQNHGKTMLIDCGTNKEGPKVVKKLQQLGITKIDYLIGTHPHEDHIGGMDDVIKQFEIGQIYMPKVATNTKTFEDVLDVIASKNLKVTTPEVGTTFSVGEVNCEVMLCGTGTPEEKQNLNLSSLVIRAVFQEQSYLFMGDSEKENEISRKWPQTNVVKVGHHGSNTSSSMDFLKQVSPQIAIIPVGKGNSYGHPKQEVINRLKKVGAEVYRTDEIGTIVLESDGKENQIRGSKE